MSARKRALRTPPPWFTLKLLLPNGKDLSIALEENEAALRISPDCDPVLDLSCGRFKLKLNRVVFVEC
jgi:hypothetical protein